VFVALLTSNDDQAKRGMRLTATDRQNSGKPQCRKVKFLNGKTAYRLRRKKQGAGRVRLHIAQRHLYKAKVSIAHPSRVPQFCRTLINFLLHRNLAKTAHDNAGSFCCTYRNSLLQSCEKICPKADWATFFEAAA